MRLGGGPAGRSPRKGATYSSRCAMVPAQLPHIAGVLDPERATEIDIREVDLIVRFQLRNYNAGCTACASMTFDESLLDRPAPQQRKAPSPRHETVRSVEIDHLPSAIGKCNGSRLYGFEPAARGRWASVVHIARHRPYLHLRRDGGCAPLSRAERSVREDRGDCLRVRYRSCSSWAQYCRTNSSSNPPAICVVVRSVMSPLGERRVGHPVSWSTCPTANSDPHRPLALSDNNSRSW